METNVSFIGVRHYNVSNIGQWMWYFRRYKFVKGFILRVFGIYINVRENNATEKLIEIAKIKNEK